MLDIIALGCGGYFANLLNTPGCSEWLSSMSFPYSKNAIEKFSLYTTKYVSKETVEAIANKSESKNLIVISAALPTNRERKGLNEAYICIKKGDLKTYYLQAHKEAFLFGIEQARNRKEVDELFCLTALNLFDYEYEDDLEDFNKISQEESIWFYNLKEV